MLLDYRKFSGMRPMSAAHLLGPTEAQVADNVDLSQGDLRSWKAPERVAAISETSVKTLARFTENGNDHWLLSNLELDYAMSSIINDGWERLFFSGDGAPKYYANDNVSTPFDPVADALPLGIPAPATAPTVGAAGGAATRFYFYQFVNRYGDRSKNGPIGSVATYLSGRVTLSNLEAAPAGYAIDRIWVWRSNAGSVMSGFSYVCEATWFSASEDYAVGDYVIYSNALYECTTIHPAGAWDAGHFTAGELVSSPTGAFDEEGFYPPPSDLKNLVLLGCGAYAGTSGRTLCMSEPFKPYAWPVEYRRQIAYDPVALAVFGDFVGVITEGCPSLFYGQHPAAMGRIDFDKKAPCLEKRTVDVWQDRIYWRSLHGHMVMDQTGVYNETERLKMIPASKWDDYAPDHGVFYGDSYFGFSGSTGIVMDFASGTLSTLNLTSYANWIDPATGQMYFVGLDADAVDPDAPPASIPLCIKLWEGDDTNYLMFTWRGRLEQFTYHTAPCYLRIVLDAAFYASVLSQIDLTTLNAAIFAGNIRGAARDRIARAQVLRGTDLYSLDGFDISASVTLKIYRHNEIVVSMVLSDAVNYCAIPECDMGSQWEVELSGYVPITTAIIASGVEAIQRAGR